MRLLRATTMIIRIPEKPQDHQNCQKPKIYHQTNQTHWRYAKIILSDWLHFNLMLLEIMTACNDICNRRELTIPKYIFLFWFISSPPSSYPYYGHMMIGGKLRWLTKLTCQTHFVLKTIPSLVWFHLTLHKDIEAITNNIRQFAKIFNLIVGCRYFCTHSLDAPEMIRNDSHPIHWQTHYDWILPLHRSFSICFARTHFNTFACKYFPI